MNEPRSRADLTVTEHPNENEDLAFNITSNSGDGLQAGR